MNRVAIAVGVVSVLFILFASSGSTQDNGEHWMMTKLARFYEPTLSDGTRTSAPFLTAKPPGLIVTGTCSKKFVESVFKGQDVNPVLTENGNGIMVIWFMYYPNSTAGEYSEIVYELLATRKEVSLVIPETSMDLLEAFVSHPQTVHYLYKLYLDAKLPIDYGRQLLGTDKYPMKVVKNDRSTALHHVEVLDSEGKEFAKVKAHAPSAFDALSTSSSFVSKVGFKTAMAGLFAPSINVLVTPKGIIPGFEGNPMAMSIAQAKDLQVGHFGGDDEVVLGGEFKDADFKPVLKQMTMEFPFAYFMPAYPVNANQVKTGKPAN